LGERFRDDDDDGQPRGDSVYAYDARPLYLWGCDTSRLAVRYAAKRQHSEEVRLALAMPHNAAQEGGGNRGTEGRFAEKVPHREASPEAADAPEEPFLDAHSTAAGKVCRRRRGRRSQLPFFDESLDVVVGIFAPDALAEYARVLRPGGALVLASAGPEHLDTLQDESKYATYLSDDDEYDLLDPEAEAYVEYDEWDEPILPKVEVAKDPPAWAKEPVNVVSGIPKNRRAPIRDQTALGAQGDARGVPRDGVRRAAGHDRLHPTRANAASNATRGKHRRASPSRQSRGRGVSEALPGRIEPGFDAAHWAADA
jgi:SAM-dependent methyltransferase